MPAKLLLYTRAGCHLCEEMKAVLAGARRRVSFELQEVDIESDGGLSRLYGESIPVLSINGKIAFKGKMTPDQFFEKFQRITEGKK